MVFLTQLFQWSVKHKRQIIGGFQVLYVLILIDLCIVAYLMTHAMSFGLIYAAGVLAGKVAIILFCLTITPGILRRFGIRGSVPSWLMLFRRHLGITTFALGFYHYAAVMLFPVLFAGIPPNLSPPLYQFIGLISLYAMSILFFTSNDWSVKKMGKWWGRIHGLIYAIAWGLFLHVVLQDISMWSVLIGFFALLETASLLYFYLLPKPTSDSEETPTNP